MQQPLLQGILMGFFLSILIGPAFFLLVETSLTRGLRGALAFDLGVVVTDACYILLALTFTSEITAMASQATLIERSGGLVFIVFGLANILKKKTINTQNNMPEIKRGSIYLKLFLKGFLLNALNPGVLIFWLGVVIWASGDDGFTGYRTYVFFGSTLSTFFCIDLIKILGSRSLKRVFSSSLLTRVNWITGSILIIFGVVIIIHSFK